MIQLSCPQCGTINQVASAGPDTRICCFSCRCVFAATGGQPAGAVPTGGPPLPPAAPAPSYQPPASPPPAYVPPDTAAAGPGPALPPQLPQVASAADPKAPATPALSQAPGPVSIGSSPDEPAADASGNVAIVAVLLTGLLLVLGTTLVVVLLIIGKDETSDQGPGERGAVNGGVVVGDGAVVRDGQVVQWTDAREKSLEGNDMRVRVDRAEWGIVRGRDSRGRMIESEKEYLSIIVNVHNRSRNTNLYESWYTGPHVAVLTDAQDRSFDRFISARFKAVEFHVAEEQLERAQEVDDRIVFAIPSDVSHDETDAFYLELPGQAIGCDEVFRFRIPVDMITDF